MDANIERQRRKDEHVYFAVAQHQTKTTSQFDELELINDAVPMLNLADVDLSGEVAGLEFEIPLYINAMTGGSPHTEKLNGQLAEVAAATGLMMAVGSMHAAIREPELASTYSIVREKHPNGVLFANISADLTPEQAQKAVDILQADALQIHVNVAQELVMKEGSREFDHWLDNIAAIKEQVDVPIIVKEVGFGLARKTIMRLRDINVDIIDLAGKGGTDFARIENARRRDGKWDYFNDWGQTTAQSLIAIQSPNYVNMPYFASGGVCHPLDAIKCLALGAEAVGIAGVILAYLKEHDVEETIEWVETWKEQMKMIAVMVNAKNLSKLRKVPVITYGRLKEWGELRGVKLEQLAQRLM
ncbi:type 2 isopentenyl-diphosphate Delta-isomerase [Brochothrix thermosphacta]|uniref:type 2 isopentenyl-diphosphate Delta-isomerase n=1 Tax=Brochothrix thermosphacta TaxID=2756 RepID=UPI0039AF86F9